MDIAAVGGAIGAVKALVGMTKATAEAIVDEKQREKLYEIRSGLMDLQERVLEDQQSRMELLKKVDELGKELSSLKAKRSQLDDYELAEVKPGRLVYKAKQREGVPAHFACPNCFTVHGLIGVLQVEPGYGHDGRETRYKCTACSFDIFVG
jgi:hypothetical protein